MNARLCLRVQEGSLKEVNTWAVSKGEQAFISWNKCHKWHLLNMRQFSSEFVIGKDHPGGFEKNRLEEGN